MKAKKSLGQHFLRSEKALKQIIEAGEIKKGDIILEIGPGEGVLTQELLNFSNKVFAVEKDRLLIPVLKEKFATDISLEKLILLENDILDFEPKDFFDQKSYKLIANIPYYITGTIIEKFLSTKNQPKKIVLLVQKEVAERIVSKDKKESVLSIAVKVYGKPKIIAKVPRGAFTPSPKVDSAILSIDNISRDFFEGVDEKFFFKLMKDIFSKKRKQIGGSLTDFLENKEIALNILKKTGIDIKSRPEEISPLLWKKLVMYCTIHGNEKA